MTNARHLALFTLAVNLWIVTTMWRDPLGGLEKLTHRPEQLPQVMTGRYAMFVVLTVLAIAYRDPLVLMGLLVGYLVASIADTLIYARRNLPYAKHFQAAIACTIGIALCALAITLG